MESQLNITKNEVIGMLKGYIGGIYSKVSVETWALVMRTTEGAIFEGIGTPSLLDVLNKIGGDAFTKKRAKQLLDSIGA